jgi:erythritol transport system ATP-binding protein
MVPEDRKAAGFVGALTVGQNMTLSSLRGLSSWGYLPASRERREALRVIGDFRIKAPSPSVGMGSLSGGNQQKVIIGRAVMSRPRLLLMDEPTRGVDVAAKAEILDTMRRLAAQGLAIVFASSELAEVRDGASRILVMARGRITAEIAAADATDEALTSAASPVAGASYGVAHG